MTDYTELKRLVEAGSLPPIVSTLIAENERLRSDLDGEMTSARDFNVEHEELKSERNHLKAENGSLRRQIETTRRGAGQLLEQNETLLDGMTRIMQSTRLGDPAFGIACEVVGELDCPTVKAVQP